MLIRNVLLITAISLVCCPLYARDKLVLELDLETDLLSLSHHIDNFLFQTTANFRQGSEVNLNQMNYPALENHLAVTALLRLNGEVVGTATEQEIVYHDEARGWMAHSMWMFQLNYPGMSGFLAVEQREDASGVSTMVKDVMSDPGRDWDDHWHMYLSTSGETRIQHASGDLSIYRHGRFEEYNGLNPADLKRIGRFRGKIKFVIYPADATVE